MKVCPKCARSFADELNYCPHDATKLARYDPRADLRARATQASSEELRFLLKTESLGVRFKREFGSAINELKNNPRAFIAGLLRGEGASRRRRRQLQAGVATALIAYCSIFIALIVVGLFKPPINQAVKQNSQLHDPQPFQLIVPILDRSFDRVKQAAKSSLGFLGGSREAPQQPHGGGGASNKIPASRGVLPTPSLQPQLRSPDPEPPKIANATLITPETIYADPKSFLTLKGPFGLIGGRGEAPSMGEGPGTGIGPGDGPGYGPGKDGNTGDGVNKPGGAKTTGLGGDDPPFATARLRPTILYKEKARYTEAARQNRVQGAVISSVTFGADGRIHNIRTVRGLPYGLTETAIEAARLIRFQPASYQGLPVSVRANLEFNFALY